MYLYYQSELDEVLAVSLATSVNARIIHAPAAQTIQQSLFLYLADNSLWLYSQRFKPFNVTAFYQDFIGKRQATLRQELLIQALKLKSSSLIPATILDLTAGLGRDALLLALAGCQVTMLEGNPFLALILTYLCTLFPAGVGSLTLIYADHGEFLQQTTRVYDYIYYDPMFEDNKVALAKKDMQLIDLCLHECDNLSKPYTHSQIFNLALTHCLHKLVVKRDNKQAAVVDSPRPTYTKAGKVVRFDVYQCQAT